MKTWRIEVRIEDKTGLNEPSWAYLYGGCFELLAKDEFQAYDKAKVILDNELSSAEYKVVGVSEKKVAL